MSVSIIAAMSTKQVIGFKNRLPWNLPGDLKRFQTLTMGHYLVLGRKTFESIGRPLPGRKIVVLTKRSNYVAQNVQIAHSLSEALMFAQTDNEIFIGGGKELYQQTLPIADRLYITIVDGKFEGDTHFPHFDKSDWNLLSLETHNPDSKNKYPYSFLTYEKSA